MRLINVEEYTFREFIGDAIPPYSILSHTWGDAELTHQDMQPPRRRARKKQGFKKIRLTYEQSTSDNLRWTWVDTCYIDKTNSAEIRKSDLQSCYG
jgi:hypothetical protein